MWRMQNWLDRAPSLGLDKRDTWSGYPPWIHGIPIYSPTLDAKHKFWMFSVKYPSGCEGRKKISWIELNLQGWITGHQVRIPNMNTRNTLLFSNNWTQTLRRLKNSRSINRMWVSTQQTFWLDLNISFDLPSPHQLHHVHRLLDRVTESPGIFWGK